MTTPTLPSEAEVLEYFHSLSNWGRWGSEDRLGTVNLVSDESRLRAAQLVRYGRSVSCAWDIDTGERPGDLGTAPRRLMVSTGQGLADPHRVLPAGQSEFPRHASAGEQIQLYPHGFRLTHLDALSHQFWDGRMYNDRPAELVTAADGATELAVTDVRDGVVTRGILLDVPAHRGVDWLPPAEPVHRWEIEAILAERGMTVQPGDALLLRTGYPGRVARHGFEPIREVGRAGWHASCLPWLREHDVAVIATATSTDSSPSGYPAVRNPIHLVGIVAMGLWLVDNCNFESLASACAELDRWEFQFVIAPLAFAGGTGSVVNPLAVV